MAAQASGPGIGDAPPIVFEEVQRFRQWFFWVPVAIVTGVVWWLFGEQIIFGHPQGQQPIPDWTAWVLGIIFGLGFPAFAATVRLVTEVTADTLIVRLAPFRAKAIPLRTIDTAMEREYSAMREFGGWGVRVSRYGKAYNARGDKGVQLILKDDSHILIGTQRSEELASALRQGGVTIIR
jgi:hypothetical protein